jgi:hypothetical protein
MTTKTVTAEAMTVPYSLMPRDAFIHGDSVPVTPEAGIEEEGLAKMLGGALEEVERDRDDLAA